MKRFFLFLFFSLILIFSLGGCAKECEEDADCASQGPCSATRCVKGSCQQIIKSDCCGNAACEQQEDSCSCPADCSFSQTEDGRCAGKVRLPDPYYPDYFLEAENAEYLCKDNQCTIGVPQAKVQTKRVVSEHVGAVSFEVVTSISQPFVIGDGSCKVRVRLTDLSIAQARAPVKITSIKVISHNELISEKTLDADLEEVGDYLEEDMLLTPTLTALEEDRDVSVKISYQYANALIEGNPVARESLETVSATIPFIDPKQVDLT